MSEFDHVLNSTGRRNPHRAIIRQVQPDRCARDGETSHGKNKLISPMNAGLIAVFHLLNR